MTTRLARAIEIDRFLNDFAKRVRLPPPMMLQVRQPDKVHPDWPPSIYISGKWQDAVRVDGGPVITDYRVDLELDMMPREMWERVTMMQLERAVYDLWLHELHEWFTVDGVHVHAPHKPDGSFA